MSTELRGPEIVGRLPLTEDSKGQAFRYRHAAEHRGYGIVAIYSYGPVGEYGQLVQEAKRAMRDLFGVRGAVSSGGISGWPKDEHSGSAITGERTVETQTIFCVHAVSGSNRPRLKIVNPSVADWHLSYIVDVSQDYLGDGEVNLYLSGALEGEETWLDKVRELVSETLEKGEKAAALEVTVRALRQGKYWFLADGDPLVMVEHLEV